MDPRLLEGHSEVIQRKLKDLGGDSQFDPVKLWVILHYPDSLKVSASELKTLLDTLRSWPDEKVRKYVN